MAESKQSRGACAYCGRAFTRSGIARHLDACVKRKEVIAAADRKRGKPMPLLHMEARPSVGGDYWLHLEVEGTATFGDLDDYLRVIWLECCGHMSRFSAKGSREEVGMGRKVAQVFRPGVELTHTYDFGTRSVTLVTALTVREGRPTTEDPIVLMARNEPPVRPCQECGSPATHLCLECVQECDEEQPGNLCEEHAGTHPHEDYEPMPLINSPRMGMCAYDGPGEPPY